MAASSKQPLDTKQDLADARQQLAAWARRRQVEEELERLTAMALAMRKSTDVSSITEAVFNSVEALGLCPNRCGMAVWKNRDTREVDVWTVVKTPMGEMVELNWTLVVGEGHPLVVGIYEAWKQKLKSYSMLFDVV